MKRTINDYTNRKIGLLTVIEKAGDLVQENGAIQSVWRCKCICNRVVLVTYYNLNKKRVLGCGCQNIKNRKDKTLKYNKKLEKWNATILINDEKYDLGYFEDFEMGSNMLKDAENNKENINIWYKSFIKSR